MARFPNIAAAFLRNMLVDAGIFREWLVSLGRRQPSNKSRICSANCTLSYRRWAWQGITVARCDHQADLADALGLTPVHINRIYRRCALRP